MTLVVSNPGIVGFAHMTSGLAIELGTHWWEVSALTTAPSLLKIVVIRPQFIPSRTFLMLFGSVSGGF